MPQIEQGGAWYYRQASQDGQDVGRLIPERLSRPAVGYLADEALRGALQLQDKLGADGSRIFVPVADQHGIFSGSFRRADIHNLAEKVGQNG